MTYTTEAGVTSDYEFPDDRLDEVLARADAKFLPAWTAQDEINFRRIMADDENRRNPQKVTRKAQDRAEGSRHGKAKGKGSKRS